jgi:hypothetical protein
VAATRWYAAHTPSWRVEPEPEFGMVTFVDADEVRRKRDPGRCYLRAGFTRDGETVGGLLALRLSLDAMPPSRAPLGAQMELIG